MAPPTVEKQKNNPSTFDLGLRKLAGKCSTQRPTITSIAAIALSTNEKKVSSDFFECPFVSLSDQDHQIDSRLGLYHLETWDNNGVWGGGVFKILYDGGRIWKCAFCISFATKEEMLNNLLLLKKMKTSHLFLSIYLSLSSSVITNLFWVKVHILNKRKSHSTRTQKVDRHVNYTLSAISLKIIHLFCLPQKVAGIDRWTKMHYIIICYE